MKMLAGELQETVYHTPDNNLESGESKPLAVKSQNTYRMNEVTYISDEIGLHRVHNPSRNQVAVSLHCMFSLSSIFSFSFLCLFGSMWRWTMVTLTIIVYTPPNAADYGYNIFDEKTGAASHVSQAHSVFKS